jgi:hypothetical protein
VTRLVWRDGYQNSWDFKVLEGTEDCSFCPSFAPKYWDAAWLLGLSGGEGEIRTLERLPVTRFPGVRLRPLGHLT